MTNTVSTNVASVILILISLFSDQLHLGQWFEKIQQPLNITSVVKQRHTHSPRAV